MALFKWEGRKAGEGESAALGQGFSIVSIKLTDWLSHGFWEASSLGSKSEEQKFNWLYLYLITFVSMELSKPKHDLGRGWTHFCLALWEMSEVWAMTYHPSSGLGTPN